MGIYRKFQNKKLIKAAIAAIIIIIFVSLVNTVRNKKSIEYLLPPTERETEIEGVAEITIDASQVLGDVPYFYRPGLFLIGTENKNEQEEYVNYFYDKFMSENLPGMTTITLPTNAGDDFQEYKKMADKLLTPRINQAKRIIKRGGKIMFNIYSTPKWLSIAPTKNEYWTYPPKHYKKWGDLIFFIAEFVRKNGIEGANYRIWEEADFDIFWRGSNEEFYQLYEEAARAIKKADKKNSVTFGLGSYKSNLFSGITKYIYKKNIPFNYVIFHPFGHEPLILNYSDEINQIKAILKKAGLNENIPIHAESWNSWLDRKPKMENGQYDERSPERDSEFNAAYAVSNIIAMQSSGFKFHSFFADTDWDFEKYKMNNIRQFYGGFGIFSKDLVIKPVYNAFKIMSIFAGKNDSSVPQKIAIKYNNENLLFSDASKTPNNIRIILANFAPISNLGEKYYKNIKSKAIFNEYMLNEYGDFTKQLTLCAEKNNTNQDKAMKECVEKLQSELTPYFKCKIQKRNENECFKLFPENVKRAKRESEIRASSFLENVKKLPRKVKIIVENIQFSGKIETKIYTIDKDNSNSCEYNKNTGYEKNRKTECGIGGAIDKMVEKAKKESEEKSGGEKSAMQNLFYYCRHKNTNSNYCIDKINNLPNVSIEGSLEKEELEIISGKYENTIIVQPYSVKLIEISPKNHK